MPALGSIRPIFSPCAVFFQNARHKQGFGQQLAIGIRLKVDIFHAGFARAEAVLRRQQRLIQRFRGRTAIRASIMI
jgi:hypothetical protein